MRDSEGSDYEKSSSRRKKKYDEDERSEASEEGTSRRKKKRSYKKKPISADYGSDSDWQAICWWLPTLQPCMFHVTLSVPDKVSTTSVLS